jgi:hypothetical protein
MAKNYWDMDIDELNAANQALADKQEAIRAERREIAAVLDMKIAEREVKLRLETMSEPERRALYKLIRAEGSDG